MVQQPLVVQGLHIIEASRRSQTHHTLKDSSERASSPTQRPLPHNTQHSKEKDIHAPGGIRTAPAREQP